MEMIAMLDGLGMNTEYPIGDVNPNTSPRYYKEPRPASPPPAPPSGMRPYAPMTSYSLGAGDMEADEPAPPAGSGRGGLLDIPFSGWLAIGAFALVAITVIQAFRRSGREMDASEPLQGGFAEPEMVAFPQRPRRKRRKSRK